MIPEKLPSLATLTQKVLPFCEKGNTLRYLIIIHQLMKPIQMKKANSRRQRKKRASNRGHSRNRRCKNRSRKEPSRRSTKSDTPRTKRSRTPSRRRLSRLSSLPICQASTSPWCELMGSHASLLTICGFTATGRPGSRRTTLRYSTFTKMA